MSSENVLEAVHTSFRDRLSDTRMSQRCSHKLADRYRMPLQPAVLDRQISSRRPNDRIGAFSRIYSLADTDRS